MHRRSHIQTGMNGRNVEQADPTPVCDIQDQEGYFDCGDPTSSQRSARLQAHYNIGFQSQGEKSQGEKFLVVKTS